MRTPVSQRLHCACRQLLEVAAAQANTDGCFELSIGNPDKGLLPLIEVRRRVQQFADTGLPVVVVQVRTGPRLCAPGSARIGLMAAGRQQTAALGTVISKHYVTGFWRRRLYVRCMALDITVMRSQTILR